MSHHRLRTFNKHITNRITRRFARLSRGPFALIRHVGRRSGRFYETPIMVRRTAEGFVVALTYGESVDWYRNVVAAGQATLLWHGRNYVLRKPEPLAVQTALPLFSPVQRLILRMRHTQHFVRMASQAGVSPSQAARA